MQVGGSSHRAEYPRAWEPSTHVLTPPYIGAPREVVHDNIFTTKTSALCIRNTVHFPVATIAHRTYIFGMINKQTQRKLKAECFALAEFKSTHSPSHFYHKREGGGLKNDDNYCNFICISVIVATKMMITIVRGGREGVREL